MRHKLGNLCFGKGVVNAAERTNEVAAYLAMIANFKQLDEAKEKELAQAIQAGNKDALDALVNANLRAVVSIAKNYDYCKGSLSLIDLINEGNIGLIEAAKMFDPAKGVRFMSFAVTHIRRFIIDALTDKSRIVKNYNKDAANSHTSLDAPANDDSDATLADIFCVSHDKENTTDDLYTDITRVLNSILKPTEITIVVSYFGIGDTAKGYKVLAVEYGKTEERIRQVVQGALIKIRQNEQAISLLAKYI